MEQAYAGALMRMIEQGTSPKEAVHAIREALRARGRDGLLPRVGRAFERLAHRAAAKGETRITVASHADAAAAQHAAGVKHAIVKEDATLIGGWRIEKDGTLVDDSYKRHLLDIYHRATRA